LLFRMVCGRPPFVARGVGDIIANHLREPPPRPTQLAPWIPGELEELILKALAKSPDERFAGMAELAARLKEIEPRAAAISDEQAVPADLGVAAVGGASPPDDVEIEIEAAAKESPGEPPPDDAWMASADTATRPLRSH